MDDLVGTQAPGRRITDAREAIEELESAMPGLRALRLPHPRVVDWGVVEAVLGVGLPSDFRPLKELYPDLCIDDFLGVFGPTPGREAAWAGGTEDLEILAEWCDLAELDIPLRPYPGPGGLLPWGSSLDGDYFVWTTDSADPDEWTVTVASRSSAWWHYIGGAVQFLADLVTGALEYWALPPVGPSVISLERT